MSPEEIDDLGFMPKMTKEQAIEIFKEWLDYNKEHKNMLREPDTIIAVQEMILYMLAEKDEIIDLMAEFLNKRSWKEHQLKDDTCNCCKIEYGADDCKDCIKKYFEDKVGD